MESASCLVLRTILKRPCLVKASSFLLWIGFFGSDERDLFPDDALRGRMVQLFFVELLHLAVHCFKTSSHVGRDSHQSRPHTVL